MPYLQFMYCDKCKKAPMDIDYKKTIEAYCKDGRRQKDVFINPAMLVWDYLVYTCTYCGESHRYKFRDVERKVREHLSEMSEEFRDYFETVGNIDFEKINKHIKIPQPRKRVEERLRNSYVSKD